MVVGIYHSCPTERRADPSRPHRETRVTRERHATTKTDAQLRYYSSNFCRTRCNSAVARTSPISIASVAKRCSSPVVAPIAAA